MPLVKTTGTGTLAANTVITAIPNGTQVTVSAAPTVALAGAAVRFIRIWEHARLATDASHLAPADSTIRTGLLNPAAAYNATTNYGVGAFIYRSANGTKPLRPATWSCAGIWAPKALQWEVPWRFARSRTRPYT